MDTRYSELSSLTYYRGRVGLYALLKALGIGEGGQVAMQAFTCLAVPEGVMAAGAKPLYVDVEASGFNMDPEDLARKLAPQTKAIVIQHTFGIPARMDALMAVAGRAGLPVIEDCCHTLASRFAGRTVGEFGAGAFYSFEWGKPLVAGIGGAARVNDLKLEAKVRSDYAGYGEPPAAKVARIQAQYLAHRILYRPSLFWPVRALYHKLGALGAAESNYNPVRPGQTADDFHWRMAAPLRVRLQRNLARLDTIGAHSAKVARLYQEGIHSTVVTLPVLPEGSEPVFCRYPLRASNKADLLRKARAANVELAEWYATPIHPLKAEEWPLVHYLAGSCPEAERRCAEVVTLPTHPAVREADVAKAVGFLNRQ